MGAESRSPAIDGSFQAEGDDHASAAAEDVGDDDLATVGNGDLSGDGQTESGGAAAAFAAVVKADEPTEHPFSVSSRDTGTVVGHLDPNTVPATTPGVGGFCVEFRDGGAIGVGMFSAASASNSIRQVAPRPTAEPLNLQGFRRPGASCFGLVLELLDLPPVTGDDPPGAGGRIELHRLVVYVHTRVE
ncbi:MAG: hypothetical protein QOF87_3523 [Pseudonocardiales bacterium]|nr:hypothetical protein [Pseudonocardiales bacterium]